ncbi:MAG: 4-hydroxy-tetrahydrodipicolinate synthase [Alphaproteobacteria bacterium]
MTNTATYTAIITPFKNDKIDEKALEKIIEMQIKNGIDGIVPCGTTGESPTLSHEEHNRLIELSVEIANKRIKIMAGTGSNSTQEAVSMTNYAKKVKADCCLIVAPYYNKPTPHGVFMHFQELDKVNIPLIIYNIPGRSVINISDENLAKIAELKNVQGIKDATGDLARVANLRLLVKKPFLYLSGEDATVVGFNAMGGNGVISVTANIAPKMVSDLQKFSLNGDYKSALELQDKLTDLHNAMFCETNPIPVKYAMSLMGLCDPQIRLPLCQPSDSAKERIKKALQKLNLI